MGYYLADGIEKAMLDLGASINVMPLSMYDEDIIGPLRPIRVVIQLADKSHVHPEGILEDVLVKVEDLIFPTDFYVLGMGKTRGNTSVMLLGRPFIKRAKTSIDCNTGQLTCEFDGEKVTFNIFKAMEHPPDTEMAELIDQIEQTVEKAISLIGTRDTLDLVIQGGMENSSDNSFQVAQALNYLRAEEGEPRLPQLTMPSIRQRGLVGVIADQGIQTRVKTSPKSFEVHVLGR